MSRIQKRKKKKKKVALSFLLIMVLLIVMPASYFAWEYYTSYNFSKKASSIESEEIEFKGDEFEGTMNVLLIGVDTRGEEEESNSDSIMIAQYNTDTKKAKLVSLLRDMYVDIPDRETKQRINASYMLGGADLLRQTIKDTFDIEIHYYAIVDFNGFVNVIDYAFPNGIEMNVEKKMSHGIWQTINPGLQQLNGKQLLGYARFRHDAQSDFGRAERQQKVIEAVTEEMVSVQGVLKLPKIIGAIQPYIATNLEKTKIASVLTSFLSSENRKIEKLVIPQEGTYTDLVVDINGYDSQVLDIDIEKNKQAIHTFLNN